MVSSPVPGTPGTPGRQWPTAKPRCSCSRKAARCQAPRRLGVAATRAHRIRHHEPTERLGLRPVLYAFRRLRDGARLDSSNDGHARAYQVSQLSRVSPARRRPARSWCLVIPSFTPTSARRAASDSRDVSCVVFALWAISFPGRPFLVIVRALERDDVGQGFARGVTAYRARHRITDKVCRHGAVIQSLVCG